MTLFTTIAHEKLKALLFPLGFKKRGNTYYRTVHDTVQGLFFKGSQFGHSCEFFFGILPEYIAAQSMDGIGRCVGFFHQFHQRDHIPGHFLIVRKRGMDEKIEKIKKYVLPYFEHPNQPPGTY